MWSIQRLGSLGVDQVLIIEFNQALASMSPDTFVSKVLVDGLGVRYVSIGDDFKFGYQRQGDISFLQQRGTQDGFEARLVLARDSRRNQARRKLSRLRNEQ